MFFQGMAKGTLVFLLWRYHFPAGKVRWLHELLGGVVMERESCEGEMRRHPLQEESRGCVRTSSAENWDRCSGRHRRRC